MQGSPVRYEFEDLSPVEKRLKVEVAKEHVDGKLDEAYRKLSRQVNLPGFRPGKAPRQMLEKMFGKRVAHDVAQDLLRDTLTMVARQSQIRMIGQPVLEDMPEVKRNEALRYSARIELFPQVDPRDYEGIEISRRPARATDEEVEAALERKRMEQVDMVPVEGRDTAQDTDTLMIRVSGGVGPLKYEGEEWQIDLGGGRPPPLPGLREALIGIPLRAEDHEVRWTLPAEGVRADLAGREVVLRVTVKQAYEKRLPPLNDDFAKDTGEAETLEELRSKIRERLLREDEEEARHEARMALLDEVVRRNPVPLPPSLVKRVADQLFDVSRQRAAIAALQEGKDPRQEGVLDEEKLRQEAQGEAVRSLSKEFILMSVADKEGVEVTQADVEKRLAEIARQSDRSVARVRAEMQKDDPHLEGLRNNLRMEKALDLLESRAKIVEAGPP